ncbi:hypothetical protein A4G99_07040 [Haladaptatus sp. R4]|uniref:hypothetical protein n=1 Tax=Haladaptatus sp. R4 TaxID=1679489 RepID=UPI0007B48187|nr:hypothetical protein [Haladaptatus sp. R4]KZN24191.1 hypothetical protein A4G99_07040 [Haladaptatus sp. R4]
MSHGELVKFTVEFKDEDVDLLRDYVEANGGVGGYDKKQRRMDFSYHVQRAAIETFKEYSEDEDEENEE